MIVLSGTDLLTGNMLYGSVPFYNLTAEERGGEVGKELMKSAGMLLGMSLLGNLAGSGMMALALGMHGGVLENAAVSAWVVKLAAKKCALPWMTAFVRGIGANWVGCRLEGWTCRDGPLS